MINAIAFVQVVTDRITHLGQAVADLPGVTEVYSFAGQRANLIAVIRATEPVQFTTITDQLSNINGVLTIDTHIAFRHYSNADIQAGFSLGFTLPDRNSEHDVLLPNLRNTP
jgi:DNA-binding Lrp family transcriptional regulator